MHSNFMSTNSSVFGNLVDTGVCFAKVEAAVLLCQGDEGLLKDMPPGF